MGFFPESCRECFLNPKKTERIFIVESFPSFMWWTLTDLFFPKFCCLSFYWNILESCRELLTKYFRRFSTKSYAGVFSDQMADSTLQRILQTFLEDSLLKNAINSYQNLENDFLQNSVNYVRCYILWGIFFRIQWWMIHRVLWLIYNKLLWSILYRILFLEVYRGFPQNFFRNLWKLFDGILDEFFTKFWGNHSTESWWGHTSG